MRLEEFVKDNSPGRRRQKYATLASLLPPFDLSPFGENEYPEGGGGKVSKKFFLASHVTSKVKEMRRR